MLSSTVISAPKIGEVIPYAYRFSNISPLLRIRGIGRPVAIRRRKQRPPQLLAPPIEWGVIKQMRHIDERKPISQVNRRNQIYKIDRISRIDSNRPNPSCRSKKSNKHNQPGHSHHPVQPQKPDLPNKSDMESRRLTLKSN